MLADGLPPSGSALGALLDAQLQANQLQAAADQLAAVVAAGRAGGLRGAVNPPPRQTVLALVGACEHESCSSDL
eukprot:SAG22_NODE_9708_length_574_cov_0.869474_1_plen_73_part_01